MEYSDSVMGFLEINLHPEDKFKKNSEEIPITAGKKYQITAEVIGLKGNPYSAYFAVIILNSKNQELTRKIQWLNDFSGSKKSVHIVFASPKNSDHAIVGYRINNEVPILSSCKYHLQPIDELSLLETDSQEKENFTLQENYNLNGISVPRPKELSEEQELVLEKNIVWIFAAPRSGTQWLGTQLLKHDTIFCAGPSIGLQLGAVHHRFKDKVVRLIEYRGDEPDYFLSKTYRDTWEFYLRKLMVNRLYTQFRDISRKIIIPDPEGSMGSDIISSCVPNSKIIILLRDGRDVLDSILDAEKEGSWLAKKRGFSVTPEKRLDRIKFYSLRWVRLIEILDEAYNNHKVNLRLKIKYEDLLKNTEKELEKIYKFIEVDIHKNLLKEIVEMCKFENIPKEEIGKGKVTRFATPGKWKENFNEEENSIMNEIMGSTLAKLGY